MDSVKNSAEVGNCDHVLVLILQLLFFTRITQQLVYSFKKMEFGVHLYFTGSLKKDISGRSKILAGEPWSKQ